MNLAGMEIVGRSISGVSTCLVLPAEKLVLDLGHPVREAARCPTVLISHAHVDHIGAIAWHCSTRELMCMPPPTYIVPPEIQDDVQGLLDAWRKLDGSKFPCNVVGLAPGDRVTVGKGLQAQAFRTVHRGTSQGYALIRTKSKLKPEFIGVEGQEIGRLKRSGVQVTDEIEVLELAWTSDTKAEVFDLEPWILKAQRLILEATFVNDENSIEEAHLKGHTHLKEIIARVDQLQDAESILLTHFSARYSVDQVDQAMGQIPGSLLATTKWLTRGLVG